MLKVAIVFIAALLMIAVLDTARHQCHVCFRSHAVFPERRCWICWRRLRAARRHEARAFRNPRRRGS